MATQDPTRPPRRQRRRSLEELAATYGAAPQSEGDAPAPARPAPDDPLARLQALEAALGGDDQDAPTGVTVPAASPRETPAERRRRLGAKIAQDRVREAREAEEGSVRTALRSFSEGATRTASNLARYGGAMLEAAALGPGASPVPILYNPSAPSQRVASLLGESAEAIAPTDDNAGANLLSTVAGGTAGEFAASQALFGTASAKVAEPVTKGMQRLAQLAAAGKLSPRAQQALGPLLERLAPQLGPAVPSPALETAKAAVRAVPGELLAGGASGAASSPLEEVTSAKNTGFSLLGALTGASARGRGVRQTRDGTAMPVSAEELLVRRLEAAAERAEATGQGGAVRRRPAPPRIGEPVSVERGVVPGDASAVDVVPYSRTQRDAFRQRDAALLGVAPEAIGPARRRVAGEVSPAEASPFAPPTTLAEAVAQLPDDVVMGPREPVPVIGEPVVAEGVGPLARLTPQSEVQRQAGRERLRAEEARRLGVPRAAIGPARRRPAAQEPATAADAAPGPFAPPATLAEAVAQLEAQPREPVPTIGEPFTMGALEDGRIPLAPEPVAPAPTPADLPKELRKIRRNVQGREGAPVEGEVRDATPAPAVRVRKDFRAMRTPDLLARLTEEQQRLDGETSDMSHGGWTRQQDDGTVISGNSFRSGKLRNQAKLTARRIEELEQELRARGVPDDDLLNARMTGVEQAAERLPFDDAPAPERDPWDPDPDVPDQQEGDAPRAAAADLVEPPVVVTADPNAFPEGVARPQVPATVEALVQRVGGEGMGDAVEAALRQQVEASGVVAQRVTFDDQRRAAQQLAGELGVEYTALRPDVASRLSAAEIGARVYRHRVNVHLMEQVSRALMRGDANPEQAARYAAALERLEADSQKVLADVLRATSQKGRDLGALRAFGRQTLDAAFWEVQAARRLGGMERLTDAMRADIRRLAREAAEACGLGG